MIPQNAIDEVRAGVMKRLHRRRTAKRSVIAALALACLALLLPRNQEEVQQAQTQPTPNVRMPKPVQLPKVAPQQNGQKPGQSPSQRLALRPVHALAHSSPPAEAAQRPAYIKVYTDNPDVVFLLLTSDEGAF